MAVANCSLPAVTTSLVLLATPALGVVYSTVLFGEAIADDRDGDDFGQDRCGVLSTSNSAQT
jgi:hypothetical protein